MHHRDEVGRSVLQYSSRSLSKCSSDCISVHVNDVQKIKIKLCVEHYVCVCVCAHLNRCPPLFFLFHLSSLPPQSPSKREEYYFFFRLYFHSSHLRKAVYCAFFFFYPGAPSARMAPRKKAAQRGGGRRCRWKRERALGVLAVLCAQAKVREKKTGESPPCENVSICE